MKILPQGILVNQGVMAPIGTAVTMVTVTETNRQTINQSKYRLSGECLLKLLCKVTYFYRPRAKYGNVMFSVCLFTGGGVTPVSGPRSLPSPWLQIFSGNPSPVKSPVPGPAGRGSTLARTGVPPPAPASP